MLVVSQAASISSPASARCFSSSLSSSSTHSSPFKLIRPKTTLFSKRKAKFNPPTETESIGGGRQRLISLTSAKSSNDGGRGDPSLAGPQQSFSSSSSSSAAGVQENGPVLLGRDNVPLEGVIQFEKPDYTSRVQKWGKIMLLAGGDVLALVLFSAIGRFSHGFSVFDYETLRTADPFIAGWFLSAYFLGGYSEDGRGLNGFNKAVIAAAKSWVVAVPLGLGIRGLTLGHFPPITFVWVTFGSTALLLIGWRAVLFSIFPAKTKKKDDMYRQGSPFELFELLTSLVRRW